MYTLPFHSASGTLADSTTYYLGAQAEQAQATDPLGVAGHRISRAGKIIAAYLNVYRRTAGTDPSQEDVSVYVSVFSPGETATQVGIAKPLTAGVGPQDSIYESLAYGNFVPVAAGSVVRMRIVVPAMVTNPTNIAPNGLVYIVDDQEPIVTDLRRWVLDFRRRQDNAYRGA